MVADVLLDAAFQHCGLRGFAGEFKQKFCDRAALSAIARQQRLRWADAACDQGKLPGKVERVLHASVHALAAGGTVNVGGVAGYEDAVCAVVINLALVDTEIRQPEGFAGSDLPQTALIKKI